MLWLVNMPAKLWLDDGDIGDDGDQTQCGDQLERLLTSCLLLLSVPTVSADKQPKKEDKTGSVG